MNFTLETMANESLITRARNNLVAKCMSNKDISHIMFIDADVGFDVESIYKLIAHDKDIVGGIYPRKHLNVTMYSIPSMLNVKEIL